MRENNISVLSYFQCDNFLLNNLNIILERITFKYECLFAFKNVLFYEIKLKTFLYSND